MLQNILTVLVVLCCASNALAVKCVTCDSTTNSECINNPSSITPQDCAFNICFTQISSAGVVTRGCLAAATAATCASPSCEQCTTDDCNTQQTVCQACDSSTNPQCAQLTVASHALNTICTSTNAQCYVGLSDTKTIRRCAQPSDTTICTADPQICQLCTGGNCNSKIYPSTRLTCYQCADTSSSTSCANPVLAGSGLTAQACANYVAGDACYTYATSATTMERGCVSDTANNQNCAKNSTNALCATCNTDSCNSRTYTYAPTLSCIKCNSKTTPSCEWSQSITTATSCRSALAYNSVEQCYMQVKDNVVYRGCIGDRSSDGTDLGNCTEANNCYACDTGNGCNSEPNFSCISCNSATNTDCSQNPSQVGGTFCKNSVNSQESAVCYEAMMDNDYQRGCLVDADAAVQTACKNVNSTVCKTCTTSNCNLDKAHNGAYLNVLGANMFALAALVAFKQFY